VKSGFAALSFGVSLFRRKVLSQIWGPSVQPPTPVGECGRPLLQVWQPPVFILKVSAFNVYQDIIYNT